MTYFLRAAYAAATVGLVATQMAHADQTPATAGAGFNLFDDAGPYTTEVLHIGATDDVAVPAPFWIDVPMRDDISLTTADPVPEGPILELTFSADPDDAGLILLESFRVVGAGIPIFGSDEGAVDIRRRMAGQILEQLAFPAETQGFDDATILTRERFDVGNVHGVEIVGTYTDPVQGPMLLRMVALPHPTQLASYVAVSRISLTFVPVVDGVFDDTLTGRIVTSWRYDGGL